MSSHIPESDWRHFKQVHDDLLERYCARVLDDLTAEARLSCFSRWHHGLHKPLMTSSSILRAVRNGCVAALLGLHVAKAADGTAHERYVRAYKFLKSRDEELARAFDDFRRSTAVMQLAIMRRMGLLSDKDLNVFSLQTQEQVRGIASIVGAE